MTMDLILLAVLLIIGLRGWFDGFVKQMIHWSSLIAAILLATPIAYVLRPEIQPHLASIPEHLFGEILWWSSVVLAYLVISAMSKFLVSTLSKVMASRGPSRDETESESPEERHKRVRRADRFAGFSLGLAKGAIYLSIALALIDQYALPKLTSFSWVQQVTADSQVYASQQAYQPAKHLYEWPPTQDLVRQLQRRDVGLDLPDEDSSLIKEATESLWPSLPIELPETPDVSTTSQQPKDPDAPRVTLFPETMERDIDRIRRLQVEP